jgi:hypothetical protein
MQLLDHQLLYAFAFPSASFPAKERGNLLARLKKAMAIYIVVNVFCSVQVACLMLYLLDAHCRVSIDALDLHIS